MSIHDDANAALDSLVEELSIKDQHIQMLAELIEAKNKLIASLERAKFSVAGVRLAHEQYDEVLQIISVDSTPDGLLIRVSR